MTSPRVRTMTALFGSAALMNAVMAMTGPVGTIAAAERLGPAWGGAPNTAAITGTALGSVGLSRLMARRGRRAGLLTGYAVALLGAALAVAALSTGRPGAAPVAALCAGMLLTGVGNAAAQLSRYAAADLYPPGRRGTAIGALVWAGAVGAVGGPLLLAPAADLAGRSGWPGPALLTGPFLLAAAATVPALLAAFLATARPPAPEATGAPGADRPMWTAPVWAALAVLGAAQIVMVVVMTALPLHQHLRGHGLGDVGRTLAAHTLGMFALAPVAGRMLDRLGPRPVALAGLSVLATAAVLVATIPDDQPLAVAIAVFLLGFGWNLCFVGGSGALSRAIPPGRRERTEGAVDGAVSAAAAGASLASTAFGQPLLAAPAALLVALAATATARHGATGAPPSGRRPRRPRCGRAGGAGRGRRARRRAAEGGTLNACGSIS